MKYKGVSVDYIKTSAIWRYTNKSGDPTTLTSKLILDNTITNTR